MWHNSLQDINLKEKRWSWLANTGSLTKYLNQQAGHENLVIKLLAQYWRVPVIDERMRLELPNEFNEILERNIVMTVMNRPWVFARTCFTKRASDLLGADLSNLASNSLGELMQKSYPKIMRGELQFAYLQHHDHLFHHLLSLLSSNNYTVTPENNIIRNRFVMRRSLFYLENTILFNIDEIFLPALINKMLHLEVLD